MSTLTIDMLLDTIGRIKSMPAYPIELHVSPKGYDEILKVSDLNMRDSYYGIKLIVDIYDPKCEDECLVVYSDGHKDMITFFA